MNKKQLIKKLLKDKQVVVNDIIIEYDDKGGIQWLVIKKDNNIIADSQINDINDIEVHPTMYIPRCFLTKYYIIKK